MIKSKQKENMLFDHNFNLTVYPICNIHTPAYNDSDYFRNQISDNASVLIVHLWLVIILSFMKTNQILNNSFK